MNRQKSQLAIIFFTVFLYLVGFGVVIPITPMLAKNFGATGFQVGLLLSIYSLMQFLFAPFWGRLSDRRGRRPILLFCLLGECLSYIAFALARNLETLFLARMFAGFFGASISTASAYISDITPKEERSKGMALLGVAFGLGFLVGPALGGGLAYWGAQISPEPHFDTSFTAYWVSALCLINFLFGLKYLKESLSEKAPHQEQRKRIAQLFHFLRQGMIGRLITVFFLSSLAMSMMEATLVLFVGDRFQWTVREVSFGFAYIGLITVISQGFLVRRLLPKLGEKKMLFFGLGMMTIALSMIPFSPSIPVLAVSQTLLALGISFTNPSTMGSISLLADPKEQGAVMGTTQGTASLGRIIGPAVGGWLYQHVSIGTPFVMSGFLAFMGLLVVVLNFPKLPDSALRKKEVPA
jgi:DHA1 family tetracycline resistance protein-like MFS transporter